MAALANNSAHGFQWFCSVMVHSAAPTPTMIRREFRVGGGVWWNVEFGDEVGGFELWFVLEYQG